MPILEICLRINEDIGETKIVIVLDAVTTSGQTVLPVKTRHIICYAHGLILQGTTDIMSLLLYKRRYCRSCLELSPPSGQTIKPISKWPTFFHISDLRHICY
jgi:hypothetical protein